MELRVLQSITCPSWLACKRDSALKGIQLEGLVVSSGLLAGEL